MKLTYEIMERNNSSTNSLVPLYYLHVQFVKIKLHKSQGNLSFQVLILLENYVIQKVNSFDHISYSHIIFIIK